RRIGKSLFGHEGIFVEPVKQLMSLRADNSGLHIVDVAVDEAGRDQAPRMVGDVGVVRQGGYKRGIGTDCLDGAAAADDETIGLMHEGRSRVGEKRVVAAKDQPPPQGAERTALGGRLHGDRYWNTSVAPIAIGGATTVEPTRDEAATPPLFNAASSAARSR